MHRPDTQPHDAQAAALPALAPAWPEDLALVQACVQGCRRSWLTLIERHERTLYFAVLNTLRAYNAWAPEDRVRDVQADVLVELVKDDFRKLRRFSGRCKLDHWLKVVAGNFTIDLLRRQRPTVSLDQDSEASEHLRRTLTADTPDADEHLMERELHDALWALAARLPEEDRRFVDLFCRHELSFEEIALVMDTTVGAIYARKNRVRKKLLRLAQDAGLADLGP